MNAERRRQLAEARNLLSKARSVIEDAADGEREYYDSMPEGLQGTERGEKANEVATLLEGFVETLEEIEGELEDAV